MSSQVNTLLAFRVKIECLLRFTVCSDCVFPYQKSGPQAGACYPFSLSGFLSVFGCNLMLAGGEIQKDEAQQLLHIPLSHPHHVKTSRLQSSLATLSAHMFSG